MKDRFRSKTVIVTGAAGGIGRETAIRFAKEGALVFGCDLNADALAETSKLVSAAGGNMETAAFDLSDADATKDWIDGLQSATGQVDILVNNASAAKFGAIDQLSIDDWRFTISNELDTVFFATRAAWPHLKRDGGVVINIASIAGWHASSAVGNSAHAAAKGGIIALTRQLAIEGAPHKIRAVSVSPGFISTPGTKFIVENDQAREALSAKIPAGRPGEAADVASFILFAASNEASYLTGTDIVVDGGLTTA